VDHPEERALSTRVIQWGTGNTGRLAVGHLARRADLDLVGVRVYNPDKVGRDAGEVCGIDPIGLIATDDREALLALPADVVLYMAASEANMMTSVVDIMDLLRSGKNVVTTGSLFVDPAALDADLHAAITGACAEGQTTFLGLGMHPGYLAEVLAPVMSRLSSTVTRISCREILNYANYPVRDMIFESMGFGYTPDDPTPVMHDVSTLTSLWLGPARVLAAALGLEVDKVEPYRDVVVTEHDIEVSAGHIAAGTVGAMRMGLRATCGDVELVVEHITRMDNALAPEWPRDEGWEAQYDGEPSLLVRLQIGIHGEDHTDQACLSTAMHAIWAIPAVVTAEPGVLTLAELHFNGRPGAPRRLQ
jgi:2,4-diaminopentanoate dehydrogenase